MDTNESSHLTSIGGLMQDIERSVDTEENQDIMEDDSYINVNFDFLPRERTSRYTKYSIEPIEPSAICCVIFASVVKTCYFLICYLSRTKLVCTKLIII